MKNMGIVHGSAEMAKPVVIGYDTVYVHTDIKELPIQENQTKPTYQYHETQYTYNEYSLMMTTRIEKLEEQNKILKNQQLDLMMCLSDLIKLQTGGDNK